MSKHTKTNTALDLSKLTEGGIIDIVNNIGDLAIMNGMSSKTPYLCYVRCMSDKEGEYPFKYICASVLKEWHNLVDFSTFKSIHFPDTVSIESAYGEHWDYFKDKIDDYGIMWLNSRYDEDKLPSDFLGEKDVEKIVDYGEEAVGQRPLSLSHLGYPKGAEPKVLKPVPNESCTQGNYDDKPTYEELVNMLRELDEHKTFSAHLPTTALRVKKLLERVK